MNTMKNKVQLIGYVGKDPVVKSFDSGTKKASFSLATNDHYYNESDEKIEQTQWHNLIAWGKTAEIAERFVAKGREIIVEGKLAYRSYEDTEGNKKFVTEIVVQEILLLSK